MTLGEITCRENLERDHAVFRAQFHGKTLGDPTTWKETKSFWFDQWRPPVVPEEDDLRRDVYPGVIQKATPEHIKVLGWKAPPNNKGLSPRDYTRVACRK